MSVIWKPVFTDGIGRRRALSALLRAGIKSGQDPNMLCRLAADLSRILSHDHDEVLEIAAELHAYAPQSVKIGHLRTFALRKEGKLDEALQSCREVLKIDPANLEAKLDLGKLYAELGDLEKGLDILQSPEIQAIDINYLCESLIKLGRIEEASSLIEKAATKGLLPSNLQALRCACKVLTGDREGLKKLQDPELIVRIPDALSADLVARMRQQIDGSQMMVHEPASTATMAGNQAFLHDILAPDLMNEITASIQKQAEQFIAQHQGHMALAPLSEELNLISWAVSLNDGGHQSTHYHPGGLISGVLYIDAGQQEDHAGDSGAIEFWRPPDDLVANASLSEEDFDTTLIQPRNGLMLLFPSHFYHRTIPHKGENARISIAFDVSA